MVEPAPTLRHGYTALVLAAWLWAVGNSFYVYLLLGPARLFRVESASFVFIAVLLPLIFWKRPAPDRGALFTIQDRRWLVLAAFASWFLTVVPFLTLPFLSDDYVFLVSYRRWSDALHVAQFFRPMFALTFVLLSRIGGGSSVPFHVVSLVVHCASACFVYVLSGRFFRRSDAAALCLVIFLLNPLQLEAVLWVSGLQELLWTFFVLAGLVVYTGSPILTVQRLAASLALIACALLSKETAISSALLVPAADWAFFRMKRGRNLPVAYAALGVLVFAYLLVRARVTSLESEFLTVPGRYFAQKFMAIPYRFFVQPWNLTAAHIPPLALCAATIVALTVLLWAALGGTGPRVFAGPVVILFSTLPVYSYFFVAPDLRATRYLYFATVGWALLVTQLFVTISHRRRGLMGAAVVLVLVLFVSLQMNARPWRTAGDIVDEITASLRARQPIMDATDWKARYGDGLEVKEGIPTVYKGVYLFVNGFAELRETTNATRGGESAPCSQSMVLKND